MYGDEVGNAFDGLWRSEDHIPAFVASSAFVPILLIMSAVKFAIVVMFYMHLKYDHKLFRALFVGPLIIGVVTLIALLMLFAKFSGK